MLDREVRRIPFELGAHGVSSRAHDFSHRLVSPPQGRSWLVDKSRLIGPPGSGELLALLRREVANPKTADPLRTPLQLGFGLKPVPELVDRPVVLRTEVTVQLFRTVVELMLLPPDHKGCSFHAKCEALGREWLSKTRHENRKYLRHGDVSAPAAGNCYILTYSTGMEAKRELHDEQNLTGYPAGSGRVEFFLFQQHRSSTWDAGLLLGRGQRNFGGQ
jgi:hypothetical protein